MSGKRLHILQNRSLSQTIRRICTVTGRGGPGGKSEMQVSPGGCWRLAAARAPRPRSPQARSPRRRAATLRPPSSLIAPGGRERCRRRGAGGGRAAAARAAAAAGPSRGAGAKMHTTQKDTTYQNLRRGLPYHTTDASLRKYFEVLARSRRLWSSPTGRRASPGAMDL